MECLVYIATRFSGIEYNGEVENIAFTQIEYQKVNTELQNLYKYINELQIPLPVALCSLAREQLTYAEQKKNGVYYTDFRIAEFMADEICEYIEPQNSIIDTAAGTGILLVSVAMRCKNKWNKDEFSGWVKKNVYAVDMSETALKGIQIAFLSLVNSIDELVKLKNHLYLGDSLIGEFSNMRKKYDYIIGNPPWGKIKLTRHMFAKSSGANHIYGSEFENFKKEHYDEEKQLISNYSSLVKKKYKLIGNGEVDFYMPFFENTMKRISSNGLAVILIPAGLIRAQGTKGLRRYLFNNFGKVKISVFDNKDRYFAIDTRFKFLCVSFQKSGNEIFITRPEYSNGKVTDSNGVSYTKQQLEKIRPDYTVPELYTSEELKIFEKMVLNGTTEYEKGTWKINIAREVDMTASSSNFERNSVEGVPIIEGRMVNNYRIGAKSYISGQGRGAVWKVNQIGTAKIVPQFVINKEALPDVIKTRIKRKRAGFCDIAGQTNERAMMSAIIPENVVCGNKVPTVIFPEHDNDYAGIYAWVGITNAFVYDWFLRRVLTTTVNYFLLKSIPMPVVELDDARVRKIIENVKQLELLDKKSLNYEIYEDLRRENDVLVANLYGITGKDMKLILQDFNLLDRGQPTIMNEQSSTITRDIVLKSFDDLDKEYYEDRVKKAKNAGAIAYISAELQREMR